MQHNEIKLSGGWNTTQNLWKICIHWVKLLKLYNSICIVNIIYAVIGWSFLWSELWLDGSGWTCSLRHRKQQNFFHPPFLCSAARSSELFGVKVSVFLELFLDWRVDLFLFKGSVNLRAQRRALSNTSFKFFWVRAEHSI